MVMCRACLATETNMIIMDVPFLEHFNLLTGLNVTLLDRCLYICKVCHDAVKFLIVFRTKCIESDWSFHEITRINQENDSPISNKNMDLAVIKDELKFEFESSDHFHDVQNDDSGYGTKIEIKELDETTTKRRKNSDLTKNKVKRKKLQKKIKEKNNTIEDGTDFKLLCGLCDKSFETTTELSSHLSHHRSGAACTLCPERFVTLPHMLAHRIDHLPAGQRVCHICSRKFVASTAINLEFHYMRVHGMAEQDAKIDCKQCKSSYMNANKLVRHVRDCHSPFRYGCEFCPKGFRNKTCLKIHSAQHKQEKNIKCDLCDFTSKYASSLLLHKRRKHSDNKICCKQCARVFSDEESLENHLKNVCKAGVCVVCAVCGKSIKKDWLTRHMRSHSDHRGYECALCPARFKYRTGYKYHMAKHAGTTPYQCDLCAKCFCFKGSLDGHRRTHTDGKPYICEICNTGFAKRYNLRRHVSSHGPAVKTSQERV